MKKEDLKGKNLEEEDFKRNKKNRIIKKSRKKEEVKLCQNWWIYCIAYRWEILRNLFFGENASMYFLWVITL